MTTTELETHPVPHERQVVLLTMSRCTFMINLTIFVWFQGRKERKTTFYYIDTSVLLEKTPLVKFIQNHIWDSSGIFSISSPVRISMISLISSLSLKLYFNLLVYDRNIFGSSSKVFGNLRKIFGNVHATSGQVLENLRKSWKVVENLRKIIKNAVISVSLCLYKKENITC